MNLFLSMNDLNKLMYIYIYIIKLNQNIFSIL